MKLWSKRNAILLVATLILFSGFGIFSHTSTPNDSECLFAVAESTNCNTGESQPLHIIKHCLNFFVGVMQTSEGLEKSLLVFVVLAYIFFKPGTLKDLYSPVMMRMKHYASQQIILEHHLVNNLRNLSSWLAFAYSYSR
ncbi:MAG: hypothetical protein ACSLEX_01450 [Minisyncoccota bacterium]